MLIDVFELEWEKFPLLLEPITIPTNIIIHRCFHKKYPLNNEISYFSSFETALSYKKDENYICESYITNKSIKLYDIRYIRMILKELLNNHPKYTDNMINAFNILTLSLGLCSLEKQIEIAKIRYRETPYFKNLEYLEKFKTIINKTPLEEYPRNFNFIEQDGIRFGETTNDRECFSILKGIFENEVDGIISPKMVSPFFSNHTDMKSPEEIILFNPIDNLHVYKRHRSILDINTLIMAKKLKTLKCNLSIFKLDSGFLIGGDKKNYQIGKKLNKSLNISIKNKSTIKMEDENKFREKNHLNPICPVVPWSY